MESKWICTWRGTLFILMGLGGGSAMGQVYSAIELDSLGGASTTAYDINAGGQVVGVSDTSGGAGHAVRWSGTTATDLGTLGGPSSAAYAINDKGQVLGRADVALDDSHMVLWTGGVPTDLTLLVGNRFSGVDLDEDGTIVGSAIFPDSAVNNPAVWDGVRLIDLGGVGGATTINNAGLIGGFWNLTPHSPDQAALWESGVLTDLGALTGTTSSVVSAINDVGQVVGFGTTGDSTRAFLWSAGTTRQLGALAGGNSKASDINERGQIVGNSTFFDGGATVSYATLWEGGEIIDLHSAVSPAITSAVRVSNAAAINDDGWIAVNATDLDDGRDRAFLLIPLLLEVSPRTLTFQARKLDSRSPALDVRLTNNGTTSFEVGPLPVTGDFAATNQCGASLPAGANCTIQVTFEPQAPGERSGTVTVGSGLRRFDIQLIGEGVQGGGDGGGGGSFDWFALGLLLVYGLRVLVSTRTTRGA